MVWILFLIDSDAEASDYLALLKVQAKERQLHQSRMWLALGYYRKSGFSGRYVSEADHPAFFSAEGAADPEEELTATIEGMFRPEDLGDDHPQCTFPARFAWLKKDLDLDLTRLPGPDCRRLNRWKADLNAGQVTLIFASAYLNNPSSMFGHTFLRFDPPDHSGSPLLMAYSVNFAAKTSGREGVLNQVYQGLFGEFRTENTIERFYKKLRTYADNESRAIWEYRFNLSSEQMEMVVLHLWELREEVFDYFFLDENCSYRVLAFLEVAFPDLGLTDRYTVYTTPVETIRTLTKRGLVESKKFRASATQTLVHHAAALTLPERKLIVDLVRNRLPLESGRLSELPENRGALVLAVASEYLAILINQDALDRKMSSQLTHRLLTERARLSIPVAFDDVPEPLASPDLGHRGHRLLLGGGYTEDERFYSFGYRNNYHSLLDPLPGFEKGAEIEFFNLEARLYEELNIELEHLRILTVTSLTPMNEFFRPVSWHVSLGAERKLLDTSRPLVYSLEVERGLTFEMGDFLLSAMADASFDVSHVFNDRYGLGIGLHSRLVYQASDVSLLLGISTLKYILGDQSWRHSLEGEVSFSLNNENAIFTGVKHSLNRIRSMDEVTLGFKHYF